ncbi:MAG: serine protease, partial [Bacteroidota bacterium]
GTSSGNEYSTGFDEFSNFEESGETGPGNQDESTTTLEELGLEQMKAPTQTGKTAQEFGDFDEFDSTDTDEFGGGGEFMDSPEAGEDFESGFQEADFGTGDQSVEKLPEALSASFPEETSVKEVVLGRDDRRKVRNTRRFPYRAIVQLTITAKNGRRYVGTGWLVSPRTVITAGHCVYLHGAGGWAKSIQVTPGMNASSKPFGTCRATSFRSVRGWVNSKKRDYDYGAIILPKNCRFGQRTGVFRFAAYSSRYLYRKYINISGYPGDKGGKTQWYHAKRISRITSKRLVYNIDTAGGQSGSPIFLRFGRRRIAIGIHTSGSLSGNSGTRINRSVKANLTRWMREGR